MVQVIQFLGNLECMNEMEEEGVQKIIGKLKKGGETLGFFTGAVVGITFLFLRTRFRNILNIFFMLIKKNINVKKQFLGGMRMNISSKFFYVC